MHVLSNKTLSCFMQGKALLSNLNNDAPKTKTSKRQSSPVVVRQEKVVVVIQDRSGSMHKFIDDLDNQLKKRKLGNQYIFFACSVARREEMQPASVYVGESTRIFPAFEEMFIYLRATMPKKVDIVFISDGEDNSMRSCRERFSTHIDMLQKEFPEIQEHRLFTIGVGPQFPSDLVSDAGEMMSQIKNHVRPVFPSMTSFRPGY